MNDEIILKLLLAKSEEDNLVGATLLLNGRTRAEVEAFFVRNNAADCSDVVDNWKYAINKGPQRNSIGRYTNGDCTIILMSQIYLSKKGEEHQETRRTINV